MTPAEQLYHYGELRPDQYDEDDGNEEEYSGPCYVSERGSMLSHYDEDAIMPPQSPLRQYSFADKSRSAKGPESESTVYSEQHGAVDKYFTKRKQSWRPYNQPPRWQDDERASLLSSQNSGTKDVSPDKIDSVLYHGPPTGGITSNRPQDDMLLRKMVSSPVSQSKRRSKSASERIIKSSPKFTGSRRKFIHRSDTGIWEAHPRDSRRASLGQVPVLPNAMTFRHYSDTSDVFSDAASSVYSGRRPSVKEMVDTIRWKSPERFKAHRFSKDYYSPYPWRDQSGVYNSEARKDQMPYGQNYDAYQTSDTQSVGEHSKDEQWQRPWLHESMYQSVAPDPYPRSGTPQRQAMSTSCADTSMEQIPPPLPTPPKYPYLRPPPPSMQRTPPRDTMVTPPPLPEPPRYPNLRTPPPVWTLVSEHEAQHWTPDPQFTSNLPPPPPPPPAATPYSPTYVPVSSGKEPARPVMMQTHVIPAPPTPPPPPSPTKPTAKPVLLPSPSKVTWLCRPQTPPPPPKPSAKPVLLNSPTPPPSPPPKPTSPKPTAKPVLLPSPTPPTPEPPKSPNKPVAKPILIQSQVEPSSKSNLGYPSSPLNRPKLSPYRRHSTPQTPPPLPMPPPPRSPHYPASPTKPVAKPVILPSPPTPPSLPPPPPPLPPWFLYQPQTQPSPPIQYSPPKPTAKPVLLATPPSPPKFPPPKYKTIIQVSPKIQSVTDSPKYKTVVHISPKQHSIVSERALVFGGTPLPPSPTTPTYFTFPSPPPKSPGMHKHVRIASPPRWDTNTNTANDSSPRTEAAVNSFVDDILDRVSQEDMLSGNTLVDQSSISVIEQYDGIDSPDFKPGQTSTPHASEVAIGQERTDESLIHSRLWKRRQRIKDSDTILECTTANETWLSQ